MWIRPGLRRVPFNANGVESPAVDGNESSAAFVFPSEGNHSWAYWGQQLQTLKPDLIATLNG